MKPDAEDFVRQALLDADLTVEYRRWPLGDDAPGKELELHGHCSVCRQDWALCRLGGPCQLMGVMGGYNAALHNSLTWLIPGLQKYDLSGDFFGPVFKS